MATHSINRIVRGNLNLKPFILSKNSTDIVNGYVQRLYQQLPKNFKEDLLKPRTAESQHETWTLLKSLRIPPNVSVNANRVKSNVRTYGNKAPITMMSSKNNFVSAPRKLLKTPNFKIYNTRKYTSSASSSSASFQRNSHDDRRKRSSRGCGIQTRSITGSAAGPAKPESRNGPAAISKYTSTNRQYNAGAHPRSVKIPTEICRDLMSVNAQLKKKIRLSKPKLHQESLEMSRKEAVDASFHGWNHPSTEHLNKLSASIPFRKPPPLSLDRGLNLLNLMEFKRKPVTARAAYTRRENARYETTPNTAHNGAPMSAMNSNRSDCESTDRSSRIRPKTSTGRVSNPYKYGSQTTRADLCALGSPRNQHAPWIVRSSINKPKREASRTFRRYS